ncbi:hypothetical protein DAMA08_022040 [Martiniozyma asiatica (nom. inval.)]|nr:hypothetical protein DAMA08_022040 [Martiniozyma asiatica]
MDLEVQDVELHYQIGHLVDRIATEVFYRQIEEKEVDAEIELLMESHNTTSLDELENTFDEKLRNRIAETPNKVLASADLQDQRDKILSQLKNQIENFDLENLKAKHVETQHYKEKLVPLINKYVKISTKLNNLKNIHSKDTLNMKISKAIQKNSVMGNFIVDLISSMGGINISQEKQLLDILLECGSIINRSNYV